MGKNRRKSWSTVLAAAIAAALFVGSVVALVCYKVQLWPSDIRWFDQQGLDALVQAILREHRYEVAVLALVVLNGLWAWVRLGYREVHEAGLSFEKSDRDREFAADLTALDETLSEGGTNDRAAKEQAVQSLKPSAADNNAGQLQIANAEINRVRRELVSCRQQLEQATQAKTQFLANMSHELRTPMNGIMGMTELLLSGDLAARERRFVSSIAASAETLLGIINDLLDFSKIESGTLYLDCSRFSMRDCVEDICGSLAQSAHVKGVELICYVDDDVPQLMDGDANRVRQILKNLVSNAIAFTSEGEVVVRVTPLEDVGGQHVLQCDVQDSGAGIAPELQASLFNAFTQADTSTTRRHGGLGMGLAITQQLVKMMQGDITFRSRLGEGTRFTFTMRMNMVEKAELNAEQQRTLRGCRVLVVDDNETNRTILYHQLNNWGVHVDTVEDGPSALSYLKRTAAEGYPYDVLILDLHMPGMDGIELARAINTDTEISGIKSLMLTSAVLDLDSEALAEIGIDKYISKPARQTLLHDSLVSLIPHVDAKAQRIAAEEERDYVQMDARVLLAEDNVVNQDVATGMLEQLGCKVELASDGRTAVEMCNSRPFDIIFMDCQMPHMDGFEATGKIRQGRSENRDTPIIALTANVMDGDRERCLANGMNDYLSKPVRQEQISDLLIKWARERVVIAQPVADAPAESLPYKETAVGQAEVSAGHDNAIAEQSAVTAEKPEPNPVRASAGAVINPEAIDTIRSLQSPERADLLHKVVKVFVSKTPQLLDELRTAVENGNFDQIKANAHSLKSSSAYLGAEVFAAQCDAIESAAATGDRSTVEARIDDVTVSYEAVESELNALLEAA